MQSDEKNAYSTKPWFNSWQLELVYNFYRGNGVKIFAGIGYQSDVYKMSHDFIYLDRTQTVPKMSIDDVNNNANNVNGYDYRRSLNISNFDDWESRICARYINIPIGIEYAFSEDFGIGLTAVPGLNFSTKNTGLKYQHRGEKDSNAPNDKLDGYINPFKCDVRLNINLSLVSVFAQVSPMPLFKDTDSDEVYPMRFGFMIKL